MASIAFPVIGTGNLNFPPDVASKIMLKQTVSFCKAQSGSNVRDIRFVVYQQDQALTAAFKQEMDKLKPTKHKFGPAKRASRLFKSLRFRSTPTTTETTPGPVSIEVVQGDLCQETTDAIVNVTSSDMKMDGAGALSKALKRQGGQQVQDELKTSGKQSVITNGGKLPARHIIHLIPHSANKDHLQQCVEMGLRLAEKRGLQSISIPAVGTGAKGLSAKDSASLIFKALNNGTFNTVRTVRIVIFQAQMLQDFQKEHQRYSDYSGKGHAETRRIGLHRRFSVKVINGDLTKENSVDAIMNINSIDMDMNKAGVLSKVIAKGSGPQVLQECKKLGKQSPGSAVMTSGGNLKVPHIIHILPGSSDKQHLQQCLQEGLRIADATSLQSISIPCVGTGGYGLAAADSAQVTFQALKAFNGSCKNIKNVRVIVYHAHMMQAFLQEQKRQAMHDVEDKDSDWKNRVTTKQRKRRRGQAQDSNQEFFVKSFVVGTTGVEEAVKSFKNNFLEASTIEEIKDGIISELSHKEIRTLRKKAEYHDVELVVEADNGRMVLRGDPKEVSGMVGEIWKEISEEKKKKQEEEQAQLLSKNIEWGYETNSTKSVFGPKVNAKIEMAHSKEDHTVQVSLRGDQFVIDLKTKTGRGQQSGEQITLTRTVKGVEEG